MKGFFGHPVGLSTLFFTEMWERFSYYGGRAMLFLFMTAAVVGENPGFGMTAAEAGAMYGLYTAVVYMTNLPGGWIADKFIGARNAVFYGGCIIALGNLAIAANMGLPGFYTGLGLIAIGTGLLKPNVSTMVGSLYPQGDPRRDSAFSIFYMGINLGAFLAPLIAGAVGQRIEWRYGFLVVAIGMILGLIQYKLGAKHLGDAGKLVKAQTPEEHASQKKSLRNALLGALAVVAILLILNYTNIFALTVINVSNLVGVLLIVVPIVYFGFLFSKGGFDADEKKRIVAIIIFYLAAALFWSAFEQAGSTLTLFADRNTHNAIFGFEFPSTAWQSINAAFIIILSGVFAWLWLKLNSIKKEPSTPMKFAIGLALVGVGFLILVPAAAMIEKTGERVGIIWLLMVYFIHTVGELFLSPVGLSAMTKLAPSRIVGQMMGIWFLGAATGNFIGGRVGGLFETFPIKLIFLAVFGTSLAAALVMFFLVPWMKRLMGEVK
ncbi:MAG TPA: oligopeptide:H+ symporter [Saprospiraceae bacterium]|nr:oligopeptide:H+ symporter [Saprospiraceae bacterium]